MMKKNIYRIITITAVFLAASAITAEEEQIHLPEVTTTVGGDSLTAGKNAIPDFEVLLPQTNADSSPLPELPEPVPAESKEVSEQNTASVNTKKTVFAEGLFGAGYKGFYTGDFTVYRTETDNPFKLHFLSESGEGNNSHPASDGFFNRKSELTADISLKNNNACSTFSGGFKTKTEGFQSKSKVFFENTKQNIDLAYKLDWNVSGKWNLGFKTDASLFTRYAGIIPDQEKNVSSFDRQADVYHVSPSLWFGWTNKNAQDNGFTFNIKAAFAENGFFDGVVSEQNNLVTKINAGGEIGFKTNFFSIDGDCYFILNRNHSEDQIKTQMLPAFNLSMNMKLLSELSTRIIDIKLKGGLSSSLADTYELEDKYMWTRFNYVPGEVTDWYASIQTSIPVGTSFTFDASGEWLMSAFGNGIYEPVYTSESNGLYSFKTVERTEFNSSLLCSAQYKIVTLSLGWSAYWLYVPALEACQNILFNIAVQPSDGIWGANIAVKEGIAKDFDLIPVIDASAFVKLGNSARLILKLDDAIKFCTGTTRAWYGTDYITNQDKLSLLVKFFF